jgi:hypothetical protein
MTQALSFDGLGTTYGVRTTYDAPLDLLGDFTISCRSKPPSTTPPDGTNGIYFINRVAAYPTNTGWEFYMLYTGGHIEIRFYMAATGIAPAGLLLIPDVENFVTVRRSGSSWSVFINRAKVWTGTNAVSAISVPSPSLNVGRRAAGWPYSNNYQGTHRDLSIFSRALSDSEVSRLPIEGAAAIGTNLEALWSLDGNGNDTSGNARHLTLTSPGYLTIPTTDFSLAEVNPFTQSRTPEACDCGDVTPGVPVINPVVVIPPQGTALNRVRDIRFDYKTKQIVLVNGDLTLTYDLDAIRQACELKLNTFQGEWFLNITAGIPWLQSFLIKSPRIDALKQIMRRELEEVPGVNTVTSLDFVWNKGARYLTITFTVNTDFGELTSSVGQG